MVQWFHVFALFLTFLSSINCNDNNTESSVANLSVSLSPMMDGMLEELKYTIDLSENETNVNRTEEETNVSINITEPEKNCSEGWTKYQNKCIKVFNEKVLYEVAEHICETSSATMISLHSAEEIEFVLQLVRKVRPTFNTEDKFLWIGAKRTGSGVNGFEWNNKKVFNNTFWLNDEPNDSGKYVIMFSNGLWGTFKEDDKKALFTCEKDPINEIENNSIERCDTLEKRIKEMEKQVLEIEVFKTNATNNAIDLRNRLEKLEKNLKKNNEFWTILKRNETKLIKNNP